MNQLINIAVVGLGQVGNYLLHELNNKKKDIEIKTGKKISVVALSAIDNLIKGGAGQAVQNLNNKFNFSEKTGLK